MLVCKSIIGKERSKNMKRKTSLETGSTLRERERESILFNKQIGAEGGSKEQLEVSMLPRDLE